MKFLVLLMLAACGHAPRPTVTGAELYAQVPALQATGQATVGTVAVTTKQVLTTDSQTFVVSQIIENCRGGDATVDVDCALALVLTQRFTVLDKAPEGPAPKSASHGRSTIVRIGVTGLVAAAAGALVYGAATCEFGGCEAIFGGSLVLIGGSALFLLLSD